MHVAVLGAGIIGVTTAWQLRKDGHEVTVIDREAEAANLTSFANAGLISPGHAFAWASPAAPGMMWRSLVRNDQAIRFKPLPSRRQWRWVRRFLGQCTDEAARRNTRAKARLCAYSQEMLHDVVAETDIAYDGVEGGSIFFYRTPAAFEKAIAKSEVLRDEGIAVETLDTDAVIERDPGLAPARDQIVGACFAPGDEGGDCRLFTLALARKCQEAGVTFRLGETITGLRREGDEIAAVTTDRGEVEADACVVCLGIYSPHLVEALGLDLPIYPVKGYSMTAPITDAGKAPRLGGVDEENLLAYCPMGDRLRITATAEIAGYDRSHKPSDFRVMTARAAALFPQGIDFEGASHWAGLRPMTPTGIPVVDRSTIDNLWLNTGHGHMGWTMSNGCARILADLVAQKQPAHRAQELSYG